MKVLVFCLLALIVIGLSGPIGDKFFCEHIHGVAACRNSKICASQTAGGSLNDLISMLGRPTSQTNIGEDRIWITFQTAGSLRSGDISAIVNSKDTIVQSIYCHTGDADMLPTSAVGTPIPEGDVFRKP